MENENENDAKEIKAKLLFEYIRCNFDFDIYNRGYKDKTRCNLFDGSDFTDNMVQKKMAYSAFMTKNMVVLKKKSLQELDSLYNLTKHIDGGMSTVNGYWLDFRQYRIRGFVFGLQNELVMF